MGHRFAGRRLKASMMVAALAVIAGAAAILATLGGTAAATEPDTIPPTFVLSGSAIEAVEEEAHTGSYELHIAATDGSESSPQSGIAKIEVSVDGSGQQSWEKYCPEGSCSLEESWTWLPANFSGAYHVLAVKVTDHAGNTTEEEITPEGVEEVPRELEHGTDTTAPRISFSGTAVEAAETGATSGEYELRMLAKDGSTAEPQSGISRIEVAVDGTTLQSFEKYCPVGNCRLRVNWPYAPDNFSGTEHVITVTVRDHAGNVTVRHLELDRTPPTIELSGALTEGLKEGTTKYPLHVHATDGEPEFPQSGVKKIDISVDGEVVESVEQECRFGSCPMDVEWTFDTEKFASGDHEILVESKDQAGNGSEMNLPLAAPNGSLPGCDPLDPSSTESTPQEVIAIPGGGSRAIYETVSGLTLEFSTPPSSFNPGTASDEELEKYGFPEPPTGTADREAWDEEMNGATPSAASACNGVPITTNATATGEEVKSQTLETPVWSGIAAFNVEDEEEWRALKGKFSVGSANSPRCEHGAHSAWVGLGGLEGEGRPATALLQTGVSYYGFGSQKPFSWVELIPRHPNGKNEAAIPVALHVKHGDRIEAYVRYNPLTGHVEFFLNDLTQGKFLPPFNIGGVTAKEYWDGSTAEFIDEAFEGEAGNLFQLENFGKDHWADTQVKNLAGSWEPLGAVSRRRLILRRTSKSELQAFPEALGPDSKSFNNVWAACKP
jgi:hypothetical protein